MTIVRIKKTPNLAEMSVKAGTIQKSGKAIEESAKELKDELDRRVTDVLAMLRNT